MSDTTITNLKDIEDYLNAGEGRCFAIIAGRAILTPGVSGGPIFTGTVAEVSEAAAASLGRITPTIRAFIAKLADTSGIKVIPPAPDTTAHEWGEWHGRAAALALFGYTQSLELPYLFRNYDTLSIRDARTPIGA